MIRWIKAAVFLVCLIPFGVLASKFFGPHPADVSAWGMGLGANPIEALEHGTGDWTLRFLLITLAITPLRRLLRLPALVRFRRMFGLFAFFYGCLHFAVYLGVDKFLNIHEIVADIAKRKYITVGFTAWVLMVPLAATSTAASIRRLGGKRWRRLHRLIYLSGIAGVIHYLWLVKADLREPAEYGGVLAVLLAYRLLVWLLPEFPARRPSPEGISVSAR
ncbi:MAG: sulfoxide reductase heme-binding subunit YedZ [Acidobacteria bacterium]|nr:sulfoxide reductase heme-binding subunit YedZ [Acidobacteriota bacterium]